MLYIKDDIDINVSILPKVLQNIIKQCEEYNSEEFEGMYMGTSEGLEAIAKSFYAEGKLSKEQYISIQKKYCHLVWS